MTRVRTLQAMVEEQVSELPRLLATRLMQQKLQPFGLSRDDALVEALVGHLLDGDGSDTVELNDKVAGTLPPDMVLEFDDADIAGLEQAVAEFKEGLPDLLRGSAMVAGQSILRGYKADWFKWRPTAVAEMDAFKSNLAARWGKGFDLLRMLIELSRDQGTAFNRRANRSRSTRRTHLNAALSHLHARALQIASEIMTLMESGFADGAMARWRTLHEVTCVAMVLHDGGNELAERYLIHEIVEAKKALRQYRACCDELGYAPFSEREARRIDREFEAVVAKFGQDFAGEYGWVAAHLRVQRPNFSQVEDAAGRAMMRSHYKMASQNVHAGAKGIAHRLGAFDGRFSAIAGATNVGFVEPGQNLGLSLLHLTLLLLPQAWTLDKLALMQALVLLQGEIAPALARSARSISRDERKIRKERERSSARTRKSRAE